MGEARPIGRPCLPFAWGGTQAIRSKVRPGPGARVTGEARGLPVQGRKRQASLRRQGAQHPPSPAELPECEAPQGTPEDADAGARGELAGNPAPAFGARRVAARERADPDPPPAPTTSTVPTPSCIRRLARGSALIRPSSASRRRWTPSRTGSFDGTARFGPARGPSTPSRRSSTCSTGWAIAKPRDSSRRLAAHSRLPRPSASAGSRLGFPPWSGCSRESRPTCCETSRCASSRSLTRGARPRSSVTVSVSWSPSFARTPSR